jgi:hypothetical protein
MRKRPRARSKLAPWLRRQIVELSKRLTAKRFLETYVYSRRRGKRVVRYFSVQGQVVECRRKLTEAQRELAALKGGGR